MFRLLLMMIVAFVCWHKPSMAETVLQMPAKQLPEVCQVVNKAHYLRAERKAVLDGKPNQDKLGKDANSLAVFDILIAGADDDLALAKRALSIFEPNERIGMIQNAIGANIIVAELQRDLKRLETARKKIESAISNPRAFGLDEDSISNSYAQLIRVLTNIAMGSDREKSEKNLKELIEIIRTTRRYSLLNPKHDDHIRNTIFLSEHEIILAVLQLDHQKADQNIITMENLLPKSKNKMEETNIKLKIIQNMIFAANIWPELRSKNLSQKINDYFSHKSAKVNVEYFDLSDNVEYATQNLQGAWKLETGPIVTGCFILAQFHEAYANALVIEQYSLFKSTNTAQVKTLKEAENELKKVEKYYSATRERHKRLTTGLYLAKIYYLLANIIVDKKEKQQYLQEAKNALNTSESRAQLCFCSATEKEILTFKNILINMIIN
jgi:hypothetical protein